MKKILFLILILFLVLATYAGTEENLDKTFPITKGEKVVVNFKDIDGHLWISSHQKDEIVLNFKKEIKGRESKKIRSYFDKIRPEIDFKDNHLRVEVFYPRKLFSWSLDRHIRVESRLKVPKDCDLWLRTTDGNIEVEEINGLIEIKSTDGNVTVSDLEGKIQIRTTDGDIKGHNLAGTISMQTTDGDFKVANYDGSLSIRTTDGDVKVHQGKGSLEVKTTDGDIEASGAFSGINCHTSDGNGEFVLESGSILKKDWRFRSGDGDIRLAFPEDMALKLDIRTGDGDIRARDFKFDSVSLSKRNRLSATRGQSSSTVHITTSDGNVILKNQ